jgi:hypothetical protein
METYEAGAAQLDMEDIRRSLISGCKDDGYYNLKIQGEPDAVNHLLDWPKHSDCRCVISPEFDEVERPEHYIKKGFEVADIIEAFEFNWRMANVVKYVLRHQNKGNPLKDLKKARWYLDREINSYDSKTETS